MELLVFNLVVLNLGGNCFLHEITNIVTMRMIRLISILHDFFPLYTIGMCIPYFRLPKVTNVIFTYTVLHSTFAALLLTVLCCTGKWSCCALARNKFCPDSTFWPSPMCKTKLCICYSGQAISHYLALCSSRLPSIPGSLFYLF